MEWGPERPHDGSAECPAAARDVPCAACDYEFGWFGLSDENKGQEWHWHRVTAYRLPADVLMPAIANDAHALDESKLLDIIRALDTGHIQDIDLAATSSAISSLWDMVIELRAQVAEAEKRGRIAGLEEAADLALNLDPGGRRHKNGNPRTPRRDEVCRAIRALIAQAKGDDA